MSTNEHIEQPAAGEKSVAISNSSSSAITDHDNNLTQQKVFSGID